MYNYKRFVMAYTVVDGKLVKTKKNKNRYGEYGTVPEDFIPPVPAKAKRADVPRDKWGNCDPKDYPKDKGIFNGACNRQACLSYPATWYNRGSYAFYCEDCGRLLNHDNRNDEFCKTEPLCRIIETKAEAAKLHCSPHR